MPINVMESIFSYNHFANLNANVLDQEGEDADYAMQDYFNFNIKDIAKNYVDAHILLKDVMELMQFSVDFVIGVVVAENL